LRTRLHPTTGLRGAGGWAAPPTARVAGRPHDSRSGVPQLQPWLDPGSSLPAASPWSFDGSNSWKAAFFRRWVTCTVFLLSCARNRSLGNRPGRISCEPCARTKSRQDFHLTAREGSSAAGSLGQVTPRAVEPDRRAPFSPDDPDGRPRRCPGRRRSGGSVQGVPTPATGNGRGPGDDSHRIVSGSHHTFCRPFVIMSQMAVAWRPCGQASGAQGRRAKLSSRGHRDVDPGGNRPTAAPRPPLAAVRRMAPGPRRGGPDESGPSEVARWPRTGGAAGRRSPISPCGWGSETTGQGGEIRVSEATFRDLPGPSPPPLTLTP
jgi:hypothetical protein